MDWKKNRPKNKLLFANPTCSNLLLLTTTWCMFFNYLVKEEQGLLLENHPFKLIERRYNQQLLFITSRICSKGHGQKNDFNLDIQNKCTLLLTAVPATKWNHIRIMTNAAVFWKTRSVARLVQQHSQFVFEPYTQRVGTNKCAVFVVSSNNEANKTLAWRYMMLILLYIKSKWFLLWKAPFFYTK